MQYTFELLTVPEVKFNWPRLRPLLASAVEHGLGEMEVDDILERVEKQLMFIAVLKKAQRIVLAVAAEILNYPRRKVLNVAYVGGADGRVMAHFFYDQLERMGRLFEVDAVQCYCRPSVARLLRRYFPDVDLAYVVMQREVAK